MEHWLCYLLDLGGMNWHRDFERCLDKRWLVRMSGARCLVTKEIGVTQDDLAKSGHHAQADDS